MDRVYAGVIPTNRERLDVETGVLGHVDHLRETLVHRIPFGLQVHGAGDETGHLGEGVGKVGAVLLGVVLAAEIMTERRPALRRRALLPPPSKRLAAKLIWVLTSFLQ